MVELLYGLEEDEDSRRRAILPQHLLDADESSKLLHLLAPKVEERIGERIDDAAIGEVWRLNFGLGGELGDQNRSLECDMGSETG